MDQEIPDKVQLTITTTPDNFVKVISENTTIGAVLYPTKYLFNGKVNNHNFKIYRLKKFAWFDANSTELKGNIFSDGINTRIEAEFSLIWLNKYILLIAGVPFFLIDIFILYNFDYQALGLFLIPELLSLGHLWFQNKTRFKKDKERYLDLLNTLFGKVDVKGK